MIKKVKGGIDNGTSYYRLRRVSRVIRIKKT